MSYPELTEEAVLYVLRGDGSSELLAELLLNWLVYEEDSRGEPRSVRAHFYAQLLRETRGDDFARELVRRLCCTEFEYHEDRHHRITFWEDPAAQDLFGEKDVYAMACALARLDPRDLISNRQETITAWFARVSVGTMGPGWTALVVREAAKQLSFIDDAAQLEAVLALPGKDAARVAARCPASGWNLVLMGYVLARGATAELEGAIHYTIHQQLDRYPHQAPLVWRWVAEGYRREAERSLAEYPNPDLTVERLWQLRLYWESDPSYVHRLITDRGWQIVTLGKGLQVRICVPGRPPVVLRHDANVDGAEVFREGDQVLVHVKTLTEGRTPKMTPAGRVYDVVLMPAAPPTTEMLAESLLLRRASVPAVATWNGAAHEGESKEGLTKSRSRANLRGSGVNLRAQFFES